MTTSLKGRAAIITGASRGIGLSVALALARLGARVVITARRQDAADAAAEQVGDNAVGFAAHAADLEQARACIEFTLQRFGRIDILINNAGTNPAFGPMVDLDHPRFVKTMDTNLWAPIMWTGLAWHAWMAAHGGTVVNTASVGGFVVGPNLGTYNISKAALIHTTRQLALELAPLVRVNAVAPGIVKTKLAEKLWHEREQILHAITPLRRLGEPEDVAAAITFLVSDAASWITGHTIVMDGGQMLAAPVGGDQPG